MNLQEIIEVVNYLYYMEGFSEIMLQVEDDRIELTVRTILKDE